MQGYLIQSGISYLTDPRLVFKYHRYGRSWVLRNIHQFQRFHIGPDQFDYDNRFLFGALMYIFKVEPKGVKYFNQARHEDGIRMYATLVQHCDIPVDTQHLVANATLQQSYYHNYPNGLLGFLHDLENAYATLSHLGKEIPDRDKLNTLKVKLHTDSTQFLTAMITQNMLANPSYTFEDALQLCELHAEQVYNHNKTSRQSNHLVSTVDTAMQYPYAHAYLSTTGKRADYNVGNGLWAILDNHLKDQLIALRRERLQSTAAKDPLPTPVLSTQGDPTRVSFAQDKSPPALPPSVPSLPQQYSSRSNLVNTDLDDAIEVTPGSVQAMMVNLTADSTLQEILAQMSLAEQDEGLNRTVRMSTASVGEGCTDIKCHMNYIHTITTQLQKMGIDCHASTSDSGADTCVFGDGWAVRAVISKGRHNLVGFDSQAARKKGLDLVTADTLTSTAEGQPVILRGHYGVHNPGSSTTLISDAQIRHAGAIVDACPMDKLAHPDGRKGSQSLYFPKDRTSGKFWRIPLTQVGGLMTFSHRVPVDEDYDQNYPIVEITLDVPWDPQAHYDDGGTLILPEINQTILAQLVQQLPAPHSIAPTFGDIPHPWHFAESFTIRADSESAPSPFDTTGFHDALDDLPDKLVYGNAFHLDLNWDQMSSCREGPPSHPVLSRL
jgi:hypothetical protein